MGNLEGVLVSLACAVMVGGCLVGEEEGDPDVLEIEGSPGLIWPNASSSANSDDWLRQHHTQIAELRPRVLILVANNNVSLDFIKQKATAVVAAFSEASRYHGYRDTSAKPQLNYQITKIADMRDDNPRGYPTDFPQKKDAASGEVYFDYEGLFTQSFAKHYGYVDLDSDTPRYLTLCELFERGLINELWMSAPRVDKYGKASSGGNPAGVYETRVYAQVYNKSGAKVPGSFYTRDWDPGTTGKCKVTVRLSEFATDTTSLNSDGDLHAKGHSMEMMRDAIAEYGRNSARFFHMDLDSRYGATFPDQYAGYNNVDVCPYYMGDCWSYPDNNQMASTSLTTRSFRSSKWSEGCGNVHFPPNARTHYDYESPYNVDTTCQRYGERTSGGGYYRTSYGHDTKPIIDRYNKKYGAQNGGGWLVYMMQNFPSYGQKLTGDDGQPMKSWWPFFFY